MICVCIHIHICVHIYIYIYIFREREIYTNTQKRVRGPLRRGRGRRAGHDREVEAAAAGGPRRKGEVLLHWLCNVIYYDIIVHYTI